MARVGFNYAVCAPRHKFCLLCLMLLHTYYAKNYAGIIDAGLISAIAFFVLSKRSARFGIQLLPTIC